MKTTLLLVAMSYSTLVIAQEVKMPRNSNGQIEYSEIIEIDSLPSVQLYSNSKMFVNTTFNAGKSIGQIKDDKAKTIITKGSIPVTIEVDKGEYLTAKSIFTVVIQSKNGKYRYSINNLFFAFTEDTGITTYASFDDRRGVHMSKKQWLDVETQTHEFITFFIENLKERMKEMDLSTAKL